MAKYVALRVKSGEDDPGDWWWDDMPMSHVPYVDDSTLTPTGLVDADGVPLWRLPNPIGFGRKIEW